MHDTLGACRRPRRVDDDGIVGRGHLVHAGVEELVGDGVGTREERLHGFDRATRFMESDDRDGAQEREPWGPNRPGLAVDELGAHRDERVDVGVRQESLLGEDHRRVAVPQHVVELGRFDEGADGHHRASGHRDAERTGDELGPVAHEHGDAGALDHAAGEEGTAHAPCRAEQVVVAPADHASVIVEDHRVARGVLRDAAASRRPPSVSGPMPTWLSAGGPTNVVIGPPIPGPCDHPITSAARSAAISSGRAAELEQDGVGVLTGASGTLAGTRPGVFEKWIG